jgi:hypothetical protein
MGRVRKFLVLIGFFSGLTSAADPSTVVTSVTKSGTIFVAEFEDVGDLHCPDLHSPLCTLPVRVGVTRILKDQDRNGLLASEFQASLIQWIGDGSDRPPYFWSDHNVYAGESYVVLAPSSKSLVKMIELPIAIEAITNKSDPIADVEMILDLAPLSLGAQAQAVAEAVTSARAPHSYFLADYAVELLRAGAAPDTPVLSQALIGSSAQAFSEDGRMAILAHLSINSMPIDSVPENLVRVLVTLTARYFLLESEGPRPGQEWMLPFSRAQVAILETYIPQIRASERGMAVLRTVLETGVGRQIQQRAAQLLADQRISPMRRAQLQQFLELIGPQ